MVLVEDMTSLYKKTTDIFVMSIIENLNAEDISPSLEDGLKTFK
jgi:hypothetical protein